MSGLPLDLSAALSMFNSPVAVYAYERESFVQTNAIRSTRVKPGSQRNLSDAVVLQMDRQELALMVNGDVSEGGIAIHTSDTLHFNTSRDDAIGGEGLQSFVEYLDFRFRVVGTGFQGNNANFNTYYAVRYQAHGSD